MIVKYFLYFLLINSFLSWVHTILLPSLTRWTLVWVNSGSWWWTGRPGMWQFMGHKESDTTEWLNRTELMGPDDMILAFLILSFKPTISFCSFTLIGGSLVPLRFLTLELYHSHIWGCWYFSQKSWLHLLWFIPSCNSHDMLCIYVKSAGWQYLALKDSFVNFEPVYCSFSASNCCFLNCIQGLIRCVRLVCPSP